MRSARIFYLLLSLLQFIFFLKLIEYVRGEDIGGNLSQIADGVEEGRAKFIAPKMKRKRLKPWIIGERADLPQTTRSPVAKQSVENKLGNETLTSLEGDGRFCPACENNKCPVTKPIAAGFPVVPFVIAVLTGVAWFVLFLIAWIFHVRDKPSGLEGEGGYGEGGYDSPQPQYGPSQDDKSSIFDSFLKPHERSISSYAQTLNIVLDSIGKLTDMYNNA